MDDPALTLKIDFAPKRIRLRLCGWLKGLHGSFSVLASESK